MWNCAPSCEEPMFSFQKEEEEEQEEEEEKEEEKEEKEQLHLC